MKTIFLIAAVMLANTIYAQSAAEHFLDALLAYQSDNYKSALKSVDKAIKKDSTEYDFYELKAKLQLQMNEDLQAMNTYTKMLSLKPNDFLALTNRGVLFQKYHYFEEAIADLEKSLLNAGKDSNKVMAYVNLSAAKSSIRDFKGAEKDLINALKIDSLNLGILTNLAQVCDELGRGEMTLVYLKKVIAINPSYFPAYVNIGFKYQLDSNYVEAEKYFNKAMELQPNEPYTYSNRAYNRLQLGDINGAMSDIEKSIELLPQNPWAYRNRGLIYLAKGKNKKACADFMLAIEKGFTEMYGNEVIELLDKNCK